MCDVAIDRSPERTLSTPPNAAIRGESCLHSGVSLKEEAAFSMPYLRRAMENSSPARLDMCVCMYYVHTAPTYDLYGVPQAAVTTNHTSLRPRVEPVLVMETDRQCTHLDRVLRAIGRLVLMHAGHLQIERYTRHWKGTCGALAREPTGSPLRVPRASMGAPFGFGFYLSSPSSFQKSCPWHCRLLCLPSSPFPLIVTGADNFLFYFISSGCKGPHHSPV
ncbi:hypothetical protein L209DRAFT_361321 [Thermothelomyces heterothallicus CBS 203.75]